MKRKKKRNINITELVRRNKLISLLPVREFNLRFDYLKKANCGEGKVGMILGAEGILISPELAEDFWRMIRGLT
jgi:hypothetical protein